MKTVLVTGKIGSGKSEVCRYLAAKGWPVYDCDSRCKSLYENIPGLKRRIENELGIEFSELGRIFTDDVLRSRLESIVFPLLVADIEVWRKSLGYTELAFIESATMLDKPAFDGIYDEVLMVQAPLEIRQSRNPSATQRDSAQTYGPERADILIDNTGTINELHKKIDKLYENKSC